jgi:A/G-specific adenine glycosylase
MAALPGSDWSERMPTTARPLGTLSHTFTHFRLELAVERRSGPIGEGWWHPIERLADAGLPTLYRRAADVALRSDEAVRSAA